jgi:hypothetical protein
MRQSKTYGLDYSASNRIMRTSSMNCQSTEPVDRRRRTWRSVDGVFGDRHRDVLGILTCKVRRLHRGVTRPESYSCQGKRFTSKSSSAQASKQIIILEIV